MVGFLYQLQHVLPNVKLLFLLSVWSHLQRGIFLRTTEELSIYCSRALSRVSPILIYHLRFKNNIVIHWLIRMCGACLAFLFCGVCQNWQSAVLEWLQTDKPKEGMETPGSAKRCGWTAFQRPGVWENQARIPGNKTYSKSLFFKKNSLFLVFVSS